jgi:hypothetical protein
MRCAIATPTGQLVCQARALRDCPTEWPGFVAAGRAKHATIGTKVPMMGMTRAKIGAAASRTGR